MYLHNSLKRFYGCLRVLEELESPFHYPTSRASSSSFGMIDSPGRPVSR
jgi:hypothetical protein